MNPEIGVYLISQYRSAAREEPAASLDRKILDLARRTAAQRRAVRRGARVAAILMAAFTVISLSQRSGVKTTRATSVRTDYGVHAGTTRYYLLTVSAIPPGAIDWR